MVDQNETIFALSSPAGRAGVAIIRVSGARAAEVFRTLGTISPLPRMATRMRLVDPTDGTPLDDAIVLYFPAPRSFTGEEVVELHVHGGRAVVSGLLAALGQLAGFRLAEPGEFTRRAFENGKLDLTEAEGLADLIDAETEAQRRQALQQLGGGLFAEAESWRGELLRAQALVEAAIDFSDERDVSDGAVADAAAIIATLNARLAGVLADQHRGEILRDGFRVAILGAPNVGKSSLLNALARRDAAIVSAEAGTTRDVVELHLNLGGLAVLLADTAGLRTATGAVEAEGIRRSVARARDADLVLWVMDATAPIVQPTAEVAALDRDTIWVLNKVDQVTGDEVERLKRSAGGVAMLAISAATGFGIADLEGRIAAAVVTRTAGGELSLITNRRHRQHVAEAGTALAAFVAGDRAELELRAEDLRLAATAIGRLVGRVSTEDVLGEIFGRFCIGK